MGGGTSATGIKSTPGTPTPSTGKLPNSKKTSSKTGLSLLSLKMKNLLQRHAIGSHHVVGPTSLMKITLITDLPFFFFEPASVVRSSSSSREIGRLLLTKILKS